MTCTACRPTITRPPEESSFERKNPETIDGDGALSIKGKPLTGPVVIDDENHTITLRGAIEVGRSTNFALWLPRGRPRFALYAFGFSSGWISPRAALTLWPTRTGGRLVGFLSFHATAPRGIGPITLALSPSGRG